MADSFQTLAQLVLLNDMNLADLDITDLLQDAPLLEALAADVASNGTQHKYLKETTAPVVGFRAINQGVNNSVSTDTLVTIALQILDASFVVDIEQAKAYRKGAQAYLAREGKRHMKSAFQAAEQQIFYGLGKNSQGYTGLADASTVNALACPMVVNAGGTVVNGATSVWFFRTNDDGNDCTVITGNDGNITIGDATVIRQADGSGGYFPAYFTPISGWLGLQIGSAFSVGRIANLTTENGKGLSDSLLSQCLERFPAARQPNIIAMTRQARGQLQRSRTATTVTGAQAPVPTEYEGIPIVVTDQISNAEALLT